METKTLTQTKLMPFETTQLPIMKYFDDAKLMEKGKLTIEKQLVPTSIFANVSRLKLKPVNAKQLLQVELKLTTLGQLIAEKSVKELQLNQVLEKLVALGKLIAGNPVKEVQFCQAALKLLPLGQLIRGNVIKDLQPDQVPAK